MLPNFFVKSQCSALKIFIWQKNFFFNLKRSWKKFLRILNASYGARVRGSVFKMEIRVLFWEFESIGTSPGFARFLGENWVRSHKKSIIKTMLEKIVSNDKNLDVNVVISHKILSSTIFDRKEWQETEWTKILRTDSVIWQRCPCSGTGGARLASL